MFTAVLPPEDVVEDLDDFLASRREHSSPDRPQLRWTLPESWHVTLGFMPEVAEHRLDEMLERLVRAGRRRRPFELRLSGGGAFPGAAAARVVHARTAGEPADLEELRRLATGARAAATRAGTPVAGGRFRPHLTLARLRRPTDVVRWLRVLDTYESRAWAVTRFALVRSHLGQGPRGRPRYETVATFPLGREG
jgi:RNA 2',3'-cyclic 3'-phosphodiesterase